MPLKHTVVLWFDAGTRRCTECQQGSLRSCIEQHPDALAVELPGADDMWLSRRPVVHLHLRDRSVVRPVGQHRSPPVLRPHDPDHAIREVVFGVAYSKHVLTDEPGAVAEEVRADHEQHVGEGAPTEQSVERELPDLGQPYRLGSESAGAKECGTDRLRACLQFVFVCALARQPAVEGAAISAKPGRNAVDRSCNQRACAGHRHGQLADLLQLAFFIISVRVQREQN